MLSIAFLLSFLLQTQQPSAPAPPAADRPPTRADILRGEYGRYRANNDLLSYHLDVRIDPGAKTIAGKNTIRFRMLSDDTRIQLDLYANLAVDRILLGATPLKYSRELNTVWVDFPKTLKQGRTYAIDFYYSGTPKQTGRFGGFTFGTDPAGRPWIFSACEGEGAAIWWPNKDQWRDEVEEMDISVSIPNGLVAFAMPIRAGRHGSWQILRPTTEWQVMKTDINKDEFEVATDLYYVNVAKR